MAETEKLPDGSAFFVAEIDIEAGPRKGGIPGQHDAVMWNPYNKVVQDHRDGTINHRLTNAFRMFAGLPIPWTPEIADGVFLTTAEAASAFYLSQREYRSHERAAGAA